MSKRKGNAQRACMDAGECRPPHHGSKDKRHYCKGKVGVEHTWRWMRCVDIPNEAGYHRMRGKTLVAERVVCTVCMKLTHHSRERCAHCDIIIREYKPPAWMAVPELTAVGAITITLERS